MLNERSAGCVIFNEKNNSYLLLHYTVGHWDFPKGNVERGEKDVDTAVRETEEETGINDLEFIEGFKEEIKYFYRRDGQLVNKEVVFFLATTAASAVKISHEHIGFVWLNYEDSMKKLSYNNSKEILKKAETFLKRKSKK